MNMEQLQKENDELKAYFERTKNILNAVGHVGVDFGFGEYVLSNEEIEEARLLFHETPAQSLRHIESRVEEETIERNVDQIRKKIDSVSYDVVKDALEYIAELFEVQPRKYKEQSDV